MARDVQEERWFWVQCLARNEEYAALLERRDGLTDGYSAKDQAAQRAISQELDNIDRIAEQRFGLAYPWDPRPLKDLVWNDARRLDEIVLESIRIRARVPEGSRRWFESLRTCDGPDPGRRFLSFCEEGTYLCLLIDVRHTSRRLRYDFERILGKIDQLKRLGKLKGFPERPRPAVWKRCLRVWDLRTAGMRNREVARIVFRTEFATDPKNAEVLATQHYGKACRWISMEWARSRIKDKGAP